MSPPGNSSSRGTTSAPPGTSLARNPRRFQAAHQGAAGDEVRGRAALDQLLDHALETSPPLGR